MNVSSKDQFNHVHSILAANKLIHDVLLVALMIGVFCFLDPLQRKVKDAKLFSAICCVTTNCLMWPTLRRFILCDRPHLRMHPMDSF